MARIAKQFEHDCEEAFRFIKTYSFDETRLKNKFKLHELDILAKYLGFQTKGLKEVELAKLILKALG